MTRYYFRVYKRNKEGLKNRMYKVCHLMTSSIIFGFTREINNLKAEKIKVIK